MLDNLGQTLSDHGLTTTTWYTGDGGKASHGTFSPAIRLYDAGGSEIQGALKMRYGIPAEVNDFQPGYGHAQRQALFAGMVQRAIEDGWFKKYGVSGVKVDGATMGSNYNPEFLMDCAMLLTEKRGDSELVTAFADVQVPPPVVPDIKASSLAALFKKKGWKFASRHTVREFTAEELAAAGIPNTPAGHDMYYTYVAQAARAEEADGRVRPDAGPSEGGYSFATVDLPSFQRMVAATNANTAQKSAGPGITAVGNTWAVNAAGLDRNGLVALAQDLLGKALEAK